MVNIYLNVYLCINNNVYGILSFNIFNNENNMQCYECYEPVL